MQKRLRRLGLEIWQARCLYLLLIPGILYFAIFHYGPMSGVILAFKKYNAKLGVWGSPWVGLTNFKRIFITPAAITAIRNTLEINLSRLVFRFPAPILPALLINEMRGTAFKRICQTVYTFPHFLSWVVMSVIMSNFFANGGMMNSVLVSLGGERYNFLWRTSRPITASPAETLSAAPAAVTSTPYSPATVRLKSSPGFRWTAGPSAPTATPRLPALPCSR